MADEDRAAELEEELDQVRTELEELQVKYDAALDEQDRKVAEIEASFEQRFAAAEKASKDELDEVQADCDQKVEDLTANLDKLRRAMTGDTCGWVEKRDKSGDLVYENQETGETAYDKPEVLNFAEVIKKIEGAEEDKAELAKLRQKVKDADSKKRESDVKFNESRAETSNLRGLNKGWKESAEVVFYCLTSFDEALATSVARVKERSDYVVEKTATLPPLRAGVERATERLAETQAVLVQREHEIRRLNASVDRLARLLRRSEAEVLALRESVAVQIERVAAPLRDELAASYALLMHEKAAREGDRQQLADLWPEGWLKPSLLQKYKTLDPAERRERRAAAEAADVEQRLQVEIREAVREAGKWSTGFDEYGRAFYLHADTGQKVWEPPAAMAYQPPPGRDELGNKTDSAGGGAVVAAKPPPPPPKKASPAKPGAGGAAGGGGDDGGAEGEGGDEGAWEVVEDEWGQVFYRHSGTGEESWEVPEGYQEPKPEISFAPDLDPKTRAVYSAR